MSKKWLMGLILVIAAMVTGVKVYLLKATNEKNEMAAQKQQQPTVVYPPEIEKSKNTIFDSKKSVAERMSQISFLAKNSNEICLEILRGFITSEISSEDAETENILRTKAIEDIAYYSDRDKAIVTLEKLEEPQRQTFLGDQMRRLVVALRFKQPIVLHTELELRQIYLERMYAPKSK